MKPRQLPPVVPDPEDPDVPIPPLPSGALMEHLVENDPTMRAAAAATEARERARKLREQDAEDAKLPVRERAVRMLARRLDLLGSIADGSNPTSERLAALREISKIADVYESPAAPQRELSERDIARTVAYMLTAGLRDEERKPPPSPAVQH